MGGNIFNKYNLRDFIAEYRKKLFEEIDKLEVINPSDMEELIERLIQFATIEPIELKEPIPSSPEETSIQRQNTWGESYIEKIFNISVKIPFSGNKDLFYCMPSAGTTIVNLDKEASIRSGVVNATIFLAELDDEKYKTELSKIIWTLNSNLPSINSEIQSWNDKLEDTVRKALENRQGLVAKKHSFMEKIGLKVNPASDEYITPNPIVKRKIPKPVSEAIENKELTPVLQDDVYLDIKKVLYNVGQAIERKPSLYLGKYEEDLRDVFLLFLETRYESASGVGEAFNKSGKTDILIKYANDGSNLFVAECKFWRGPKKFLDAIDQLMGYLTHRDSKTSLMIFIDQKEPSSIIETAKNEIKKHPQFKRYIRDSYNTSICYEMSFPDDSLKTIQMEMMFFHFPK